MFKWDDFVNLSMKNLLSQCLHLNKSNKYSTGVYLIYHIQYPNKTYVGSTSSTYKYGGFYHRFNDHYRELNNNNHYNEKLQNVVNKYGLSGIKFLVLEEYPSELCLGMEQYYINIFDPYYNINKNASNSMGYKHKKEFLEKRRSKIVQYDLNGNFIKVYSGIKKTEKKYNKSISGCLSGRYSTACGYVWKFKNDVLENDKIKKKISVTIKSTSIKLVSYNLDGSFYKIYESLTQACNELNGDHGCLSHHLNGETRRFKNLIFKHYKQNYPLNIEPYIEYHKNQLKVIMINQNTNETVEYSSFRKAAKLGEISRSTLMYKNKQNIKEFYHPTKSKKYKVIIEDYS